MFYKPIWDNLTNRCILDAYFYSLLFVSHAGGVIFWKIKGVKH